MGLATIAGELGLAVGINWYATWDGARVNGKSVEGFTCPARLIASGSAPGCGSGRGRHDRS